MTSAASRKPRIITARYAGTCEACRKPIAVGDRIVPCAGVYNAWDHEACGVIESAWRVGGWIVEFVDGHQEHVGTRSFKHAAGMAQSRRPHVRIAVVRRAK